MDEVQLAVIELAKNINYAFWLMVFLAVYITCVGFYAERLKTRVEKLEERLKSMIDRNDLR